MSGQGAPVLAATDGQGLRVAVVAAQWHTEVMDGLLGGALRALAEAGVAEPEVVRVPGSFELPIAASVLAASGVDAVVALGVIIRGGTPHFDYIAQGVTAGLTRVAVDHSVPVGFGVLTCDTEEQARARAGLPDSQEDKGYEAAVAALATVSALSGHRARTASV